MLDLLVICVEAGLSLDQATARTAEELTRRSRSCATNWGWWCWSSAPAAPRADAWKHLAERTGVDSVRNLVSMLVQSEQFGTSIAKTLRVHSDTLRTQRVQEIEEKAAKTSVKLVFPLVFFIFPSLFLVVLGSGGDHHDGFVQSADRPIMEGRRSQMDSTTIVRIVAGVLFVIVLVLLIQRRRTRVK